jgi:hypothetical protein
VVLLLRVSFSLLSPATQGPYIARRRSQLCDVDPCLLVEIPIGRASPLLQPTFAIPLDYADVSGNRAGAGAIAGHPYSINEGRFRGQPIVAIRNHSRRPEAAPTVVLTVDQGVTKKTPSGHPLKKTSPQKSSSGTTTRRTRPDAGHFFRRSAPYRHSAHLAAGLRFTEETS